MKSIEDDRRAALETLRKLCRKILTGYDESIEYGLPAYGKAGKPADMDFKVIESMFRATKESSEPPC